MPLKIHRQIFIITGLIIISGLLAVFSASHAAQNMGIFQKQVAWVLFSIVMGVIIFFSPFRVFVAWSGRLYVVSVILLFVVLAFGKKVNGATSWMDFGFISFQPSEIAKIAIILALSNYVSRSDFSSTSITHFLIALSIVFVPLILILVQPDTGTAITIIPFFLPVMLISGLSIHLFFITVFPVITGIVGFFDITIAIILTAILYAPLFLIKMIPRIKPIFTILSIVIALGVATGSNIYVKQILKPHQIKRIKTFLDPSLDSKGTGYNAIQSKVAIGSGGLFGKGYLNGTQTQLRFIPAQSTDFIFCIIGEEFGFAGSVFVLFLFARLIYLLIRVTFMLKNNFARCVCISVATVLFSHVVINVGMTLGLLPVIGVPLPFVSYGGSSMLASCISIGICTNFSKNIRNLPLNKF